MLTEICRKDYVNKYKLFNVHVVCSVAVDNTKCVVR